MIIIRTDANEHIGLGHLMRCLTIADAFKQMGDKVLFVTSNHIPDGLINEAGFSSVSLEYPWKELESDGTGAIIADEKPEWILVDSYYVTENYLSELKAMTHTAYLDDLNAAVWDVDCLINYNIYATRMDYSSYSQTQTKLLLGPTYAPLRREFYNINLHPSKAATDILVLAGGADPERITEKLMCNICPLWKHIRFHFVIGALNPRIQSIKAVAESRENVSLHINVKQMSSLMQQSDIAVSAAGSTLYELCACGVPAVVYTLADNQLPAAKEFERQNLMIYAGDGRRDKQFIANVDSGLSMLINSAEMRIKMSRNTRSLVDGKGAARLVHELL